MCTLADADTVLDAISDSLTEVDSDPLAEPVRDPECKLVSDAKRVADAEPHGDSEWIDVALADVLPFDDAESDPESEFVDDGIVDSDAFADAVAHRFAEPIAFRDALAGTDSVGDGDGLTNAEREHLPVAHDVGNAEPDDECEPDADAEPQRNGDTESQWDADPERERHCDAQWEPDADSKCERDCDADAQQHGHADSERHGYALTIRIAQRDAVWLRHGDPEPDADPVAVAEPGRDPERVPDGLALGHREREWHAHVHAKSGRNALADTDAIRNTDGKPDGQFQWLRNAAGEPDTNAVAVGYSEQLCHGDALSHTNSDA